jgi:hypothetical protein
VIVPVARSLCGNQDEIKKTLDKLYTSGKNQVTTLTDHNPQRRNRQDQQIQNFVILVHPTDPRDRKISEDVAPDLIQRMLNIGENFMTSNDYQSFVCNTDHALVRRVGLMPASPLDLSTLERFQRLLRFHTLGVDLLYGIHPSLCPVCNHDLRGEELPTLEATHQKSTRSQFQENEGSCPNCQAKWSWRTCTCCGGKIPKLEPLKMKTPSNQGKSSSYAIHAMAREQLLGRDQLAALCESDEVPESGRIREICPHCGVCTGRAETRQKCRRCNNGLFTHR